MNGAVVVVGSINVDLVVRADRLPAPGETVLGPRLETLAGGKGANAAVAAAAAGARVHLVAAVGDDGYGRDAVEGLLAASVLTDYVAVADTEPTGAALIAVSDDGENQIAVGAGANSALDEGSVRKALAKLLPKAACILVSAEIPAHVGAVALHAARAANVRAVLNPAPASPALLPLLAHGAFITPNASECLALAGMLDPPGSATSDPGSAAVRLAARTGNTVLVTLGSEGVLLAEPDGKTVGIQAPAVTVRDTTGAGDTFNGALATELARGADVSAAARVACAAAARSVTWTGARPPRGSRP